MKNKIYILNIIELKQVNLNVMRRLGLIFAIIVAFVSYGFSQNDTTNITLNKNEVEDDRVPIDSSILEFRNKVYIIVEYEESMTIDRIDLKTGEKKRVLDLGDKGYEAKKDTNKFRGHWSGIEVGINELASSGFDLKRPEGHGYLDFDMWRSWDVNINFAQFSIPLARNKRVGLVTGLGLEMNNYCFQDNNSIQVNEITENIEERVLNNPDDIRKSKLRTAYLTAPLIFEVQLGKSSKKQRYYISGGVIGGLKVGSSIKVIHKVNDNKHKLIERGEDLNINKWRAGVTARIGHKDKNNNSSGWFATYYLTPFFEEDKAPKLYPFEMGFRIDF